MAVAQAVMVGMAEIQTLKGSGQLTCLGLGSCIGLCGYDPTTGVAGMVHIMLPEAFDPANVEKPGKFADTGVPALVHTLEQQGANATRMVWAMAGGAQVFRFSSSPDSKMDIGARNAKAVTELARKLRLRILAEDIGGSLGRTLTFSLDTGEVRLRTVSQGEKLLCRLRG